MNKLYKHQHQKVFFDILPKTNLYSRKLVARHCCIFANEKNSHIVYSIKY